MFWQIPQQKPRQPKANKRQCDNIGKNRAQAPIFPASAMKDAKNIGPVNFHVQPRAIGGVGAVHVVNNIGYLDFDGPFDHDGSCDCLTG